MSHAVTQRNPLCGAKTRDGDPCKNPVVTGRSRCRMHGGKSLAGIASPRFKGYPELRRRKAGLLPDRMQEAVEAADRDKQLASLREDVVILDARIAELITRVDAGESGRRWIELREAQKDVRLHKKTGNRESLALALAKVDQLILGDAEDFQVWEEIMVTMDRKRKLVESERKRLVELRAIIPADRALTAMRAVLESVREEIMALPIDIHQQRQILNRIGTRAFQIMNMPANDEAKEA